VASLYSFFFTHFILKVTFVRSSHKPICQVLLPDASSILLLSFTLANKQSPKQSDQDESTIHNIPDFTFVPNIIKLLHHLITQVRL
jgi:hypothetical protein